MLREARIILPYDTGDGEADRAAHLYLTEQLTKFFGGFTVHSGQGAWAKDPQTIVYDEVRIYDVAIEDNNDTFARFSDIAVEAGHKLHQDSVYVRGPKGDVEIIPLKTPTDIATEHLQEAEPTDHLADGKTLGQKRLPAVGEIWETRCGALVAVLSAASILDGGYNVVSLTRGQTPRQPGVVNVVDLDGFILRDHTPAAYDLVRYKKRFDD